jgi:hypothetical protein
MCMSGSIALEWPISTKERDYAHLLSDNIGSSCISNINDLFKSSYSKPIGPLWILIALLQSRAFFITILDTQTQLPKNML